MNAAREIVREIPEADRSVVEQFRLVALQYCDADAAASLMEELKTTTLAKMKADIIAADGPMPDNKAEVAAKCAPEWSDYIREMCAHRAKATKLKLQLEYLKMRERQEDRQAWASRSEMRMSR